MDKRKMDKKTAAYIGEQVAEAYINDYNIEITQYHSGLFFKKLINHYNAEYIEYPFQPKILGHTLKDQHGITITVNSNIEGKRKNFTTAHEIGHLVLHAAPVFPLETNNTLSLNYNTSLQEVEANNFAAHFMLPNNVMRFQILSKFSITAISNTSGISKEAVYWRIVNFLVDQYNFSKNLAILYADEFKRTHLNSEVKETALHRFVSHPKDPSGPEIYLPFKKRALTFSEIFKNIVI